MAGVFSVIGLVLLVLLYILASVAVLLAILVFSKVTFIFRHKEIPEFFLKIWFIRLNITKIASREKKVKAPKVVHFSGAKFGEFPVKEKSGKKKKVTDSHIKASPAAAKQKKGIPEILDLVREIIYDCSEPFGKCAVLKIKKLHVTAASESPDKTAILFGHMNTAAASLVLAGERYSKLEIRDGAVGVYSDFVGTKPRLDAEIELILKVRHTLSTVIKALKSYLKNK